MLEVILGRVLLSLQFAKSDAPILVLNCPFAITFFNIDFLKTKLSFENNTLRVTRN